MRIFSTLLFAFTFHMTVSANPIFSKMKKYVI